MHGSQRESEFSSKDSTNGCWEPSTAAGTGKSDWTSAPLSDGKPSHFHPEIGAQILTTSMSDEVLSLPSGGHCIVHSGGARVWDLGCGQGGRGLLRSRGGSERESLPWKPMTLDFNAVWAGLAWPSTSLTCGFELSLLVLF